jgi:hypothetical protein
MNSDGSHVCPIQCFICNGSIKKGDHFIIANRMHRMKWSADDDEIDNGFSCFQICMPCADKIRNRKIELEFKINPVVHLLDIEKEALVSYIMDLQQPVQRRLLNDSDKICSLYSQSLKNGRPYIELEIHEEINNIHPKVVPSTTLITGILCLDCLEHYLLWL